MNGLDSMRQGLSRTWDSLREGWEHLREQAAGAITRFTPVRAGDEVESRADRLALRAPDWGVLTADVQETDDAVEVRLEAPGMDADDFELEVVNHALRVSGDKRVENEATRGRVYVLESAYGRFERLVPLPAEVDPNGARARYRRGVLRVTLPKSERSKRRRIEVESG
jgi:HSP20 family protein